jgi:dTDP-4-dehydrorhamnose reductase
MLSRPDRSPMTSRATKKFGVDPMKTLLIGSEGQVGTEIVRIFGPGLVPVDLPEVDVTEPATIARAIEAHRPDAVINTAAYHNVPDCEKNPELAFRVNALGVRHLAAACRAAGCALVHFSTDYIFDGLKSSPYDENDVPHPLNTYGISKLTGEFFARLVERHYVVRLSSVFGAAGCKGKGGTNFVKTMLARARAGEPARVSVNITSSPTYARDAARLVRTLLEGGHPPGVYHGANGGSCTWHEFAEEIFRLIGYGAKVGEVVETEELAGVRRPLYSPLVSAKLPPARSWREALVEDLRDEGYPL